MPSAVTSGTTTSTPDGAVAGAVAHDHGVVGVVGAGGRDHAATRRPSATARPRGQDVADGRRRPVLVGADDGVAVLAVLQPVELPLAQPPGGVARAARRRPRTATQRRLSRNRQRPHAVEAIRRAARPRLGDDLQWRYDTAARGPLRPGGDRPAGLADRPLQPALLLLHARRGPRLAARRRACSPTTRSSGWSGSASSSSASARSASPVASRWYAAAWSTSCAAYASSTPTVDLSLTTNALGLARTADALADAGLDRVNVSLDTRPRRDLPRDHPPRPARRRARRPGGRRATPGSGRSRSTPCCCAASTTTRRPSCCAGPRPGLRAAVHRADAAGRPARLEPRRDGHRRRDLRAASSASSCSRRPPSRGGARRPSCSSVDGGPATVGVIASVTRPFCGDCDRVRLTADGQVRNCLFAREESDLRGGAARRRHRRRDRRPLGRRDARQARRPRHRRPDVPAARPADVGHRRLRRGSRRRRRPAEPCVRLDVLEELRAPQEVRRATSGARRRPARPCGARACAAWGCSRAAPRWRALAALGRAVDRDRMTVLPGRELVPDGHGEAVRHHGIGRGSWTPAILSRRSGHGRPAAARRPSRAGSAVAQLEAVGRGSRRRWPSPPRCTAGSARRAIRTQREPGRRPTTTAPTKQTVRRPIEIR